jgi:hypothetical protein
MGLLSILLRSELETKLIERANNYRNETDEILDSIFILSKSFG